MTPVMPMIKLLGAGLAVLLCAGASVTQARAQGTALAAFSSATGEQPPAPWRVVGVPGGKIPLTRYALVELDGRKVLRVEASKSYGNLVHDLPALVPEAGLRLRWRWRLDEALRGADLRRRDGDDSALKVCALFDMPLARLEQSGVATREAAVGDPVLRLGRHAGAGDPAAQCLQRARAFHRAGQRRAAPGPMGRPFARPGR